MKVFLIAFASFLALSCDGGSDKNNPTDPLVQPAVIALVDAAKNLETFDSQKCDTINDLLVNDKITNCADRLAELEAADKLVAMSFSCNLTAEETISLLCNKD